MTKLSKARLNDFLHWVEVREAVRKKKEAGEAPPWTRDRIIAGYRFCNVRRKDDKVSRWIIERIIHRYESHPGLWAMLALARYVNWTPSLEMLMEMGLWPETTTPDWTRIGAALDHRVEEGHQTWTGAYMIRAESNPEADWYEWGKGRYVAEVVIGGLFKKRKILEPNLKFTVQRAHETIREHGYGWGSFMAGQVVADLTYTSWLRNAPDLYTWAPLGPGSIRGLNRLHGRELKASWSQEDANGVMVFLREVIIQNLGPEFDDLTLHDVQNCLCEVDKYLRVKMGEGRPRSLYRAEAL